MNNWINIEEREPAEGTFVLVQTTTNNVCIFERVRHGRTHKLVWHDGNRYMDNEMVKYWQP